MPTVVKTLSLPGGFKSKVYDYRASTPANGGAITLRACVHHIPVIRQAPGRQDLDTLRRVLIDQGYMVQFGDDAEGNVALYTRANRLCHHARGGNLVTCGIEHMHYLTSEAWGKRQMCAAAWIAQYLKREFSLPLQMADVDPGPGKTIVVNRKGHTSHQKVSADAGYHDRSDPGSGFDYEKMFRFATFFERRGHFRGV